MATSMKKTTAASTAKKEKEVAETSKRVFKSDDLIPCRSITFGELLMVGNKTKYVYQWADYDDVQDVEYQDLLYDIRIQGASFSRYPRFIVLDDDFVEQNPILNEVYAKIYSVSDLRKVLDLSPSELKKTVSGFPKGVKDSLKTMVATMVSNGTFDSVNKIKVLDEVLETQMFQTLFNA